MGKIKAGAPLWCLSLGMRKSYKATFGVSVENPGISMARVFKRPLIKGRREMGGRVRGNLWVEEVGRILQRRTRNDEGMGAG